MTSENTRPDISVCPTEPIDIRFAAVPAADPPPVFVDSTGRRRRRVHGLAYAVGLACTAYLVLVGVSIAGGAATPGGLLPFPDLVDRPEPERSTLDGPRPAATPGTTLTEERSAGEDLSGVVAGVVPTRSATAAPGPSATTRDPRPTRTATTGPAPTGTPTTGSPGTTPGPPTTETSTPPATTEPPEEEDPGTPPEDTTI